MLADLSTFLTAPRFRKTHGAIITFALAAHIFLHYATYIPALRSIFGSLPYFRLHVLHEAEFLFIVVYAALVFRIKGGMIAVVLTAIASIPFILTPYIFGREPRPNEIRDLTIMVGFILLMGALMTILYEAVARGKERQLALAVEVEEANKELSVKNEALGSANNQLTGLNQMIQKRLNVMFDELQSCVNEESTRLAALATESPNPLKARFQRFIDKINVIALQPEDEDPVTGSGGSQ